MRGGGAGTVLSTLKLSVAVEPAVPPRATLVRTVQLPSAPTSALAPIGWVMLPVATSTDDRVVLSVSVLPSGRPSRVVTTSPTAALAGRPIASTVPSAAS